MIKAGKNNVMANFVKTDDIVKDMCGIIESSRQAAYQAVNTTLVQRNWLIGCRIAEEELQGEDRAEYGASVIKKLAKELTAEYGKGFTKTNLYHEEILFACSRCAAYPRCFGRSDSCF